MILPDFADGILDTVTACCSVESKELRLRFHGNRYVHDATYGNGHWLHVVASSPSVEDGGEESVHFHIDAVSAFGDEKTPATSTLDDLRAIISSFYGETCRAWFKARYTIPVDKFPKSGLVAAMSRLSTKAGGSKLRISGMRFRIEDDDDVIDEVEWWQSGDDKVVVVIDAIVPTKIDGDLLKNAEAVLSSGLNRILLGDEDNESRSGTGN